ncbi:hypothetical protein [Pyxidicoccus xibeiensis]|uniref:hypothetical protein n=1 Tax=Pyxidicoccus xibeiensis TaxID=2906759 RepID=UPI0020A7B748|nr:hypothetical protein [Pyxidicoccus xibeiensis]MCP3137371.1 hypothetical protein [Pyxidicoccus xibeiensis]
MTAHPIWMRVCLVTAALGLVACETEEIQQLRDLARTSKLVRAELKDRLENRAESERELQTVERRLRLYCPPTDKGELLSRLKEVAAGADVTVLHERDEGVVLRLQWEGETGNIVDTLEVLGKHAPFLSLRKLAVQREAWSADVDTGPACLTLEASAATVTRFPLPPRGVLWAGTSKQLRAEIVAAESDIQRWESTTLAGGLARLNSRRALHERRRDQQLDGPDHLTGQLRLVKGLLGGAVVPELTLSKAEGGEWLLESNPAGMDAAGVERLARAGYRLAGARGGLQVLMRR